MQECPICGQILAEADLQTFTVHVNECMDKQQVQQQEEVQREVGLEKDQSPSVVTYEDDVNGSLVPSVESGEKAEQAKSWTQLFRKLPWKIAGIWSGKDDVAPGMNDIGSPEAYFGEESNNSKEARPQRRTCPLYKKLPGTLHLARLP